MSDPLSGLPPQHLHAADARETLVPAGDGAAPAPDAEEPLALLQEASDALLRLPDAAAVLPALLGLVCRLFRADACGVWRLRPQMWELVAEVTGGMGNRPPELWNESKS